MNTKISSYSLNNPVGDMSFAPSPLEIDSGNMQIANCFRRLSVASALAGGAAFLCAGICTVVPSAQLAAEPLLIAGGVCAAVAIVFASRLSFKAVIEKSVDQEGSASETGSRGDLTKEDVLEEEELSEVSYRQLTIEENNQVATHYQQIIESSETDLGAFRRTPKEIVKQIMTLFAETNLHEMALVCKPWKIISYMVQRDVFPFDTIFGVQAYETLTVKAAGKIPPMPLRAYGEHKKEKEISLIAKAIIRINQDGTDGKVEVLSSKLLIELTGGPTNKGYKIELDPTSRKELLDVEKPPSKSYWLCRGTKTISKGKQFAAQTRDAQDEGIRSYVTSLREIFISVGGNFALSGKCSPIFDKTGNWVTLVRVSDRPDDCLPCVSFYPAQDGLSPARLDVNSYYVNADDDIGVVPARKSIGT